MRRQEAERRPGQSSTTQEIDEVRRAIRNDRITEVEAADILRLPVEALKALARLHAGPCPRMMGAEPMPDDYGSPADTTAYSRMEAERYARYADLLRFGASTRTTPPPQDHDDDFQKWDETD